MGKKNSPNISSTSLNRAKKNLSSTPPSTPKSPRITKKPAAPKYNALKHSNDSKRNRKKQTYKAGILKKNDTVIYHDILTEYKTLSQLADNLNRSKLEDQDHYQSGRVKRKCGGRKLDARVSFIVQKSSRVRNDLPDLSGIKELFEVPKVKRSKLSPTKTPPRRKTAATSSPNSPSLNKILGGNNTFLKTPKKIVHPDSLLTEISNLFPDQTFVCKNFPVGASPRPNCQQKKKSPSGRVLRPRRNFPNYTDRVPVLIFDPVVKTGSHQTVQNRNRITETPVKRNRQRQADETEQTPRKTLKSLGNRKLKIQNKRGALNRNDNPGTSQRRKI